MRAGSKKKASKWTTLGALLGGLVAAVTLGTSAVTLYKYLTRPILESRYIFLKEDCLYLFTKDDAKPESIINISKPVFARVGLMATLRDSMLSEETTGSKTRSALFLSLRNVSGQQAERVIIRTNDGDGSVGRIEPDETVIICVAINWDGKSVPSVLVKDVELIDPRGTTHHIDPGKITPESEMVTSGKHCAAMGYPP